MKKYKKLIRLLLVILSLIIILFSEQEFPEKNKDLDLETYYQVASVIDGDTFNIINDHKTEIIRILGIDTPETVDPRKSVQCFGKEASDETKKLLLGTKVRFTLSPNRELKDKYGRYLAYVYREDGLFINEYLIQNGYAREYTYGKAYSLQKSFKEIEQESKINKRGLWGECI